MTAQEWFRNGTWDAAIESHFFEKLRRARRKSQYLRIQASYLAKTNPAVALSLLEKYFALGEDFDLAQAYLNQAEAHLALGDKRSAIACFHKALKREKEFPRLKTNAWEEYVLLVAIDREKSLYHHALAVLADHKPDATSFPVNVFSWFAAFALICDELSDRAKAKEAACKALEWSEAKHSGFRYHPQVGLVGAEYDSLKTKLQRLCESARTADRDSPTTPSIFDNGVWP